MIIFTKKDEIDAYQAKDIFHTTISQKEQNENDFSDLIKKSIIMSENNNIR